MSQPREGGRRLSFHVSRIPGDNWLDIWRCEIERLAYEFHQPRLLLAISSIMKRVGGTPENDFRLNYPLGERSYRYKGMFMQMVWECPAFQQLL
jgi:hypothetical protein